MLAEQVEVREHVLDPGSASQAVCRVVDTAALNQLAQRLAETLRLLWKELRVSGGIEESDALLAIGEPRPNLIEFVDGADNRHLGQIARTAFEVATDDPGVGLEDDDFCAAVRTQAAHRVPHAQAEDDECHRVAGA